MNTFISATSRAIYKYAAKPIMFKIKPDRVHNGLLKTGATLQKAAPIRKLLKASWAYKNERMLSQEILGITFHNPVGLSAGFDNNFELPPLLKAVGFGFMEGGSLTYRQSAGNPRPWFHRLPKSKALLVYKGLANDGVHRIVGRLKSYPKTTFTNFPLNISVAKTNSPETVGDQAGIDDYIGSLKVLQKSNLGDMYTLNISCPNAFGGEPFSTPARLQKLLKATDALNLKKPLFIKMPNDMSWDDFKKLVAVADKHKVEGLTIGNLVKNRKKVNLADELPDSVMGNMGGRPTWELSNELIRQTYKAYKGRFVIIGVGGIFSAEDAYTKIKLGANIVELITGMIYEGPQLIGQINRGLAELARQDGYDNISQAIGADID